MTTPEVITETFSSTMAPNVGPSCAAVGGEDILRRDTGYVSFGGTSHLALSTPRDFRSTVPSQNQPDNGGDYGHYFSRGDNNHTFKNVTFRGAGRTKDKHHDMISDASDESSGAESMEEPRRHVGGGSRGGAPRHTPPHSVGGSHGGALPRPTPSSGVSNENGGAHPTPPPSSMGYVSGRREENANRRSQSGRSAGGAMPHRSSWPLDASPRRRRSVDRSSRVLPTLKLGTYNGSTCLKTFLAKFENCSDYYDWDDREKLCHLRASLEGPAGQVLWDAGQQTSVEEVIILLKNRFGSLNEEERYRSELKARRRRRGEPLQAVYQDIRRLMALAFPGQSGPLWEIMARDAFVESLADPALRLRVLERDPETLEQALKLATRLEALGYGEVEDNWDDMGRRKDRFVKASVAEGNRELTMLVQELRTEVAELAAGMTRQQAMSSEPGRPTRFSDQYCGGPPTVNWQAPSPALPRWQTPPTVPPLQNTVPPASTTSWTAPPIVSPAGYHPEVSQDQAAPTPDPTFNRTPYRGPSRSRDNDRCHYCRQKGHWKAECPHRERRRAQGAASQRSGTRTYLKIFVAGRDSICLLDTGCDLSMLPRRFVPHTPLSPTDIKVYAANGTVIPVMGTVTVKFSVDGVPVHCRFLVSDAVDEPMLGIDWLEANNCAWDFVRGTLVIGGKEVELVNRPRRPVIRRVYVEENAVVPPLTQVNVPVRLAWTSYERGVNNTEWVLDPKQACQGVLVARSLLPKDGSKAFVRVLNLTDQPRNLHAESCVGSAYPAQVVDDRPSGRDPGPPHVGGGAETRPVAGCSTQGPVSSSPVPPDPAVSPRPAGACDLNYLQPVIDGFPRNLSPDELSAAKQLVYDYADVFSRSDFDLGHCDALPHRIDTGDARPFKEQLRRHPIAHLDFIDDQVDKMLQAGVIEPCSSPWSSNVVLAKKADGSLRFCVDYRKLNDLTYKDSFPLPRIDTCLDALGDSMYFSTMDLRSGFWQVAIDPCDADKTAFVTRKGQFRFKVLSFGLANSPSIFQRLMTMALAGLHWDICLVYIDDIIVMGRSFEEHLRNVGQVFQRLRLANLKLKPTKCRLFQERVTFLGHVISSGGIEPDPGKISCIATWPEPRNLTELRSFLGLASYYKSFVEGFGETARPLYELTKKSVQFEWGERHRQAFESLKAHLCSAPVLATPTAEGDFVLDVDASTYGVGAILHQYQKGVLRVISYASRQFNTAERAYCTTRQELAAVVFGLKRFRQYLLGRRVLVRSDHAALTYLRRTKEPVAQQARWLDFVEQFDIVVQHRSGSAHRAADALSRRPCETSGPCKQCTRGTRSVTVFPTERVENWEAAICVESRCSGVVTRGRARAQDDAEGCQGGEVLNPTRTSGGSGDPPLEEVPRHQDPPVFESTPAPSPLEGMGWSKEELQVLQKEDTNIGPVQLWLEAGVRPPREFLDCDSSELKTYWAQFDSFVLVEGVVYRKFERPDGTNRYLQLLLPKSLRQRFLEIVHAQATGHFAYKKTLDQVQRRAFWDCWKTDVKLYCECCKACNEFYRGRVPKQAGLKPLFAGAPMEVLHVDLTGPHVTSQGYRYIMTACDSFTRFVIAVPLRNKTAFSVARALVHEVVLKFGIPHSILTDLGSEFQNELWKEMCQLLGIGRLRTTAYCPSTNGKIERWHRSLHAMMAKVVDVKQKKWVEFLPFVTAAYNSTVHDSTSFSPNFLLFGRELVAAVDIAFGCPRPTSCSVSEYAYQTRELMAEAYALVRAHTRQCAEVNKRLYDASVKPVEFKAGELVWYFCPRSPRGTSPKWNRFYSGPHKVVRRVNDVNYAIQLRTRGRSIIVHVNKLKKYKEFQLA